MIIPEGITIKCGAPDFSPSLSKVRLAITDAIWKHKHDYCFKA